MNEPAFESELGLPVFASWWTNSRREIHQWLNDRAPPLAEIYEGAHRLIWERPPGWTRFVAHGIREIINRLPDVVGNTNKAPRLDYSERVGDLRSAWHTYGDTDIAATPDSYSPSSGMDQNVVAVPVQVAELMHALLEDHQAATNNNRQRSLAMMNELRPSDEVNGASIRIVANRWTDIGRWATKVAHGQLLVDAEHDDTELIRHVGEFEAILQGLTRPFFENKVFLDDVLEETNT